MKPTYYAMLLAFAIVSCAPLKKAQIEKTDLPSLGLLGKVDNSLLNRNFQQLGPPSITKPIAVAVSVLPFTKSQFRIYADLKAQKGEKMGFKYIDSVPEKPKYYRLEVKDKIGLKTVLNRAENDEARAYLTRDTACKIVSGISFYAHPMETEISASMKNLFLTSDDKGMLQLELINGTRRQIISIPENEIFAYDLMGFCWGEDIYGHARIELLNDNGNCPEGTEKNAQKLDDVKSFLKL